MSDATLFSLGGVVLAFAVAGSMLYGRFYFQRWQMEEENIMAEVEAAAPPDPGPGEFVEAATAVVERDEDNPSAGRRPQKS